MFSMMISDGNILIWVLLAAVVISLGLSATTLILQIRQSPQRGQTPIAKAKANQHNKPPTHQPPVSGANLSYPPLSDEVWKPPTAPGRHNDNGHTEALFTPMPPQIDEASGRTEHLRNDIYRLLVRESSPDGVRDREISVNGEFSIGRSVSSNLKIDHNTVSGLQCALIAGPDNIFVINRSNTNKTCLNGVKLEGTQPIKSGDTLVFGSVKLTLLDVRKYVTR